MEPTTKRITLDTGETVSITTNLDDLSVEMVLKSPHGNVDAVDYAYGTGHSRRQLAETLLRWVTEGV